jgi:hypothetical protein
MNSILYNITLIILCCGIILMTIYITNETINRDYLTINSLQSCDETINKELKNNSLLTGDETINQQDLKNNSLLTGDETIYDLKPSNIYSKMFSNSSVWFGYSDFDEKDITDKIYVKST